MTVVRRFNPENRLAKLIELPGGLSIAEALRGAADAIESVREECVAALDEKIAALDSTARAPSFDGAQMARLYALSCEVLDEAGAIDLPDLSAAGRSLCDLLVAGAQEGRQSALAVRVHVDAMKTLRHPEMAGAPELRAAVLAGLRDVTEKTKAKSG